MKGYIKAYKGFFTLKEAKALLQDFEKSETLKGQGKIKARNISKNQYDIFVKV